ncbi:MAG: ABC transporter ATP-binding protein [Patescibacteria group bacterium]|jgi:ABC-2 type transport system ATP-binding protein
MITITNLSKSYSKHQVVDDLSLQIPKGSIFGFLGPNGAGKTTTMKMIVGLATMSAGRVEVDGNNLKKIRARENIGYMPEDPYFYDHLNAMELLEFMASLFRARQPKEKLISILEQVGLANVAKKKIRYFSKGMKQRLGLAQALVNDPDYLFLDEPLDGLDPIGRLEFKRIFLQLNREGKTIFFNSHVLSDVEEICDRIGIINRGKLIYAGDVKSFCGKKSLEKRFVEIISALN